MTSYMVLYLLKTLALYVVFEYMMIVPGIELWISAKRLNSDLHF